MDSFCQAYRIYRQEADGYTLDSYSVCEFIDGYQVDETLVTLSEAMSLGQRLQKFERMLRRTGAFNARVQERKALPLVLGGWSLPRLSEPPAANIAALYSKIAEQALAMDEDCIAHLTALCARTAAIQAAIENAIEADGYQ